MFAHILYFFILIIKQTFHELRSRVFMCSMRYTCIAHIFPSHCYFHIQQICCLFASTFIFLYMCVARAEGKKLFSDKRVRGKNCYIEVVSDQYELRRYKVCTINRGCENIISIWRIKQWEVNLYKCCWLYYARCAFKKAMLLKCRRFVFCLLL